MRKVIIVGGGAAGMMAAISASENGAEVTLLEKNEKLGKKVFITGKGRCNVTNGADMEELRKAVVTNPKFLYSAFDRFTNRDVMALVEAAGCPLKEERGARIFPVSDHSSDVIAALRRRIESMGVTIRYNTEVTKLLLEDRKIPEGEKNGQEKQVTGVRLNTGEALRADGVILCTGGLSYPVTGSDGAGHRMAEESGHQVKPCVPALVPLTVAEDWCKDLMGLSLKNVTLKLVNGKKILFEDFGEMLFAHFGITGPLALSASSFYGKRKEGAVTAVIDLKPALDEEQLDKRILRDFEEQINKQFRNSLGGLLPSKMIPVAVRLSGIDPEKPVHDITREERKNLVHLLKNLTLTITGTRPFPEAIITQGGVSVKDVNPSTMESKRVKGLYFAGELLDLDAVTGGFNLQIAWSTAYLAAEGISGSPE